MAKKRKKNNKLMFQISLVVLIMAALATILLLLKSYELTSNNNDENTLTGIKLAFGFKEMAGPILLYELKGNMLFLVALVLPVIGGVIQLVNKKWASLAAMLIFALGIILLFVIKDVKVVGLATFDGKLDIKLTVIGYISIVLSALAIVTSGIKLVNQK